jgi:hypothetical protein
MKMIKLPFRYLLIFTIILTGLALFSRPAGAHTEGKLQLSAAQAGPYQTSVWTSPDPAAVGELHVALSVVLAEDASPVLDAAVLVQLTSLEDGAGLSSPATTEDSTNKFLYEAILEPDHPGPYLVTIKISGSDGGNGAVSFELELVDDSGFDPLYLIPIALALAAGGLLILSRRGKSVPVEDKTI